MHSKDERHVLRIGFWASLLALLGAVGYFLSALLQISGVLTDLQDAVLAFGSSLLMPVPFLLAMLALHRPGAHRSAVLVDGGRRLCRRIHDLQHP